MACIKLCCSVSFLYWNILGYWFWQMPLTSKHWVAGIILFISFTIEWWEMMIAILNSALIAEEFGLSTAQIGSLIGVMFLGMIPGALVVTFPYFEELVPVKVRGRATVYLSAGWPAGLLVAVGVTALFMNAGWRWIVGFSSLVALWSFAIYKLVPESPYWLAEQGRTQEANKVIRQLSNGKIIANTKSSLEASGAGASFFDIFRNPVTRVTLLQTVINFCFSWGCWALASWMPALLAKRGLSAPEGLGFIAISAIFMFPGYITASYLTGRLGRKKTMLIYVLVAIIAGLGFANSATINQMYFWNFSLSFFSLGAWGVWNTWKGAIYDTRIRGAGVGWGVSTQRVANVIAPVAIGAMLASSSFLQTVTFISAFLVSTFVTVMFVPETEGKILT